MASLPSKSSLVQEHRTVIMPNGSLSIFANFLLRQILQDSKSCPELLSYGFQSSRKIPEHCFLVTQQPLAVSDWLGHVI